MGQTSIEFSTYPQNTQNYPHSFPLHAALPIGSYTQAKITVRHVIDRRTQKTYTFPRVFLSTTALGTTVI